uniref:GRANULINS domain-containing protein n=1 Tax=Rhabditophanes sp. KR3021 TaxID=114890 RepID=A0AC35U0I6_9BILA
MALLHAAYSVKLIGLICMAVLIQNALGQAFYDEKPQQVQSNLDYDSCSSPWQWKCDNGECIASYDVCTDIPQCSDESDEKYCAGITRSTTPKPITTTPKGLTQSQPKTITKQTTSASTKYWNMPHFKMSAHAAYIGLSAAVLIFIVYIFVCNKKRRSVTYSFRKGEPTADDDEDDLLINSMYS